MKREEITAAHERIHAAWVALKDAMKHLDETADDGVAERVRLAAIECWNLYLIVVDTVPTDPRCAQCGKPATNLSYTEARDVTFTACDAHRGVESEPLS